MKVLSHEAGRVSLTLESSELVLLNNALNEILNGPQALAPAQFPTRLGVKAADVRKLMTQIQAALEPRSG